MTLLGLLWLLSLWFGLSLVAAGLYRLLSWWVTR